MCVLLTCSTLEAALRERSENEKTTVGGTITKINTYIPLLKQAAQQQPPSEPHVEENLQARRKGGLCANPIPWELLVEEFLFVWGCQTPSPPSLMDISTEQWGKIVRMC